MTKSSSAVYPITEGNFNKSALTVSSSIAGSRISMKSSDRALFTKSGKRKQMAKILVATAIPIVVLLVQTSIAMNSVRQINVVLHKHYEEMENNNLLGRVINALQDERFEIVLFLSSSSKRSSAWTERLNDVFNETDMAIRNLSWRFVISHCGIQERCLSTENFIGYLDRHRQKLTKLFNESYLAEIAFYEEIILGMAEWVQQEQKSYYGTEWQELVAYHILILYKEQVDVEKDLGLAFFENGGLSLEEIGLFSEKRGESNGLKLRAKEYSATAEKMFQNMFRNTTLENKIEDTIQLISANITSVATASNRQQWVSDITKYLDIVEKIQESVANEIIKLVKINLSGGTRDLVTQSAIIVLIMCLSPVIIVVVRNLTHDLQVFAVCLKEKAEIVKKEKRRTEYLLHQILPKSVAEKLKNKEPVLPEYYDSVTVFFSDVVGFTRICSESSPLQVVEMLNTLYQTLDSRIEIYDVYKVETIGDAYMVASGVPLKTTCHCEEIATMAVDLLASIQNLSVPHRPDEILQLRIGLHTGPCVAGVVGFKMPRYCLFGDTINTASRMESTGQALKIHISKETFITLSEQAKFDMSPRGEIEIKGKGTLATYWLHGKKGFQVSRVKQTTFANNWSEDLFTAE